MSKRYRHGMNWIRQEKRLAIYLRDKFACIYCGAGVESEETIFSLDHVKHYGGNQVENLVTACMDCNTQKGNSKVADFVKGLPEDREVVLARVARALATPVNLEEAKQMIRSRKTQTEENPF